VPLEHRATVQRGRLSARPSVDQLSQDVGMPCVASSLLEEMHEHTTEVHRRFVADISTQVAQTRGPDDFVDNWPGPHVAIDRRDQRVIWNDCVVRKCNFSPRNAEGSTATRREPCASSATGGSSYYRRWTIEPRRCLPRWLSARATRAGTGAARTLSPVRVQSTEEASRRPRTASCPHRARRASSSRHRDQREPRCRLKPAEVRISAPECLVSMSVLGACSVVLGGERRE